MTKMFFEKMQTDLESRKQMKTNFFHVDSQRKDKSPQKKNSNGSGYLKKNSLKILN